MNWGVIIFLIVLGAMALVLEFLVVPGGIVGIIGGLCLIAGIVMSYTQYGALAGNITLIVTILITIAAFILMLRSRTWKKLMLHTKIEGKMNEINEEKIAVGMNGMTISRLAPSGKGKFGDEIVEIFSVHDFIDVNSEVTIIKIEGNKIIVKLK
ncbi:MAG: NfeD family protein [Bacteroidales bacterium]